MPIKFENIMKSKIVVFALVFVAYCCKSSSPQGDGSVVEVMAGGNKVNVLLLDKVKRGTVSIPLSALVEDFEIVQLEMHEDAVFHPSATITVTENFIGVRPIYADNYKLFDRSGKFLCSISKRGNGPGEYTNSLTDDIIDEQNGLIYLAAQSKIFVYNLSGEFLKEFVPPQSLGRTKIFLSDEILSVIHPPRMFQVPNRTIYEADAMLLKFDVNTSELLEKLAPPFEHLILRNWHENIFSAQNVKGVFDFFPNYWDTEQYDTLYHIDVERNKFLPFFAMEYKLTKANDKPIFFQLTKNLMMTILIETTSAGPYVVTDLIATDLISKTSARVKMLNDYLGNIDGLPYSHNRSFNKGYYARSFQPEELIEDIEKRLTESSCTENDREILQKTLSTLKEGTNNVVFIGKIRDEIKLWTESR